jgi:archaellum component FlaC
MNFEIDIIMNMYIDVTNNIEHIKNSRTRILKIVNDIKDIDNNYFDVYCNYELFKTYLNMYNDSEEYNNLINNLETLKKFFEYEIKNKCEHEWTNDLIDIDPDRSQEICYCVKCEITKK